MRLETFPKQQTPNLRVSFVRTALNCCTWKRKLSLYPWSCATVVENLWEHGEPDTSCLYDWKGRAKKIIVEDFFCCCFCREMVVGAKSCYKVQLDQAPAPRWQYRVSGRNNFLCTLFDARVQRCTFTRTRTKNLITYTLVRSTQLQALND